MAALPDLLFRPYDAWLYGPSNVDEWVFCYLAFIVVFFS
jgi:hypothetical protein